MIPKEADVAHAAISMHVDHPFFLAIRDNTTGMILFESVIRSRRLNGKTSAETAAE